MLLMWNVNYRMLEIMWNKESCVLMSIFWIVFWIYVIHGERLLCELLSDEIIADNGNMKSVIWDVD
jgi:hypothetical protein